MTRLHQSNLARMARQVDPQRLEAVRRQFRAGSVTRYLVRPLLAAVLVVAVMAGAMTLLRAITLDERWARLYPLFLLVALEAVYTTNWLRHPDRLQVDRTAYRGAELLLILIVVRMFSWVVFGEGLPDLEQLEGYLRAPLTFFVNIPFLVTLVITIIAWYLAVMLGSLFSYLEVSEVELRFYSLPLAQRKERADDQPIQAGRRQLVQDFARYWIWGGAFLAICVGLSSLDMQSVGASASPFAIARLNLPPEILGIMLLYFGVGFWLLSDARLMELNARWLINGVGKDVQTERSWRRVSLFVLLLIGFAAAFLPIGSTLAIGQLLGTLLFWLLLLVNLIIFLVTLPFALILALISGRPLDEVAPQEPLVDPATFSEMPPLESNPLGETVTMILSSAFWTAFIVVAVLALLFFLRERKSQIEGQSASSLWQRFVTWLRELWAAIFRQARAVRVRLPRLSLAGERAAEPVSGSLSRWRFVRLRGLSPRDQIRYFYLAALRRAKEQGVRRRDAETPLEFQHDLQEKWPEVDEEVEGLTEAFLKARYSDAPIDEEDLPPVKEKWKDVRRQLRKPPETRE